MTRPNISLKIIRKGKVIKKVTSHKTKRIYKILKAENFRDCLFCLRVTYDFGCNEGEYETDKDALHALKVFLELRN